MKVGIITCFVEDPNLFKARMKYLERAVKEIESYKNIEEIIISVNTPNYLIKDKGIDFIRYFSPKIKKILILDSEIEKGPGANRNNLLKYFYSSKEEYFILMDDDVYISRKYGVNFDEFLNQFYLLKDIKPGILTPFFTTRFVPIRTIMKSEDLQNYIVGSKLNPPRAFSIFRNFKLLDNLEFYFKNDRIEQGYLAEDFEMDLTIRENGFIVTNIHNLLLDTWSKERNSTHCLNQMDRKLIITKSEEIFNLKERRQKLKDKKELRVFKIKAENPFKVLYNE